MPPFFFAHILNKRQNNQSKTYTYITMMLESPPVSMTQQNTNAKKSQSVDLSQSNRSLCDESMR